MLNSFIQAAIISNSDEYTSKQEDKYPINNTTQKIINQLIKPILKTLDYNLPISQQTPLIQENNYELYYLTKHDIVEIKQSIEILAYSFCYENPLHKYLNISYEDELIYYSTIVNRSVLEGTAFIIKEKNKNKILFVTIYIDFYNYINYPLYLDYQDKLDKDSGIFKLRKLIEGLNSNKLLNPSKTGEVIYSYCAAVNHMYKGKGVYPISVYFTNQLFTKLSADYKYGITESINSITEHYNKDINKAKLVKKIKYKEYESVNEKGIKIKPFVDLEEYAAKNMNLKGCDGVSLFLYDMEEFKDIVKNQPVPKF